MRLAELNPRWIHPDVFVFDCPCCRKVTLSCKKAPMPNKLQFDLFIQAFKDGITHPTTVPSKQDFAWAISGSDFSELTVTPSIDAGAAGHWHGYITKGEIR